MGITKYSSYHHSSMKLMPRWNRIFRNRTSIIYKSSTPLQKRKRIYRIIDEESYPSQEELEFRLSGIQERVHITRQYIRSIRYEYTGSAREAVDEYLHAIAALYSRIVELYIKNIRDDYPIFESVLSQFQHEYIQIITDGGFTEEEAYDYIYGFDSPSDADTIPDDSPKSLDTIDEEFDAICAMKALYL
jgi:hypothetical protein